MKGISIPCITVGLLAGGMTFSGEETPGGYDGFIKPFRVASLGMPSDGRLKSVLVDRGDLLEENQILALLDFNVEEATLEIARARASLQGVLKMARTRAEYSQRRVKEAEKLFGKGVLSEQEIDQVRTEKQLADLAVVKAQEDLRIAQLDYERSQALVERGKLRSPFHGVVVERFLSPGEMVQGTSRTPVLKVAQVDPLLVEVYVPSSELGRFRIGGKAQVIPQAPGVDSSTARIVAVDRVVDPASDTFGIRLELPNPDGKITAGLHCTVRFNR